MKPTTVLKTLLTVTFLAASSLATRAEKFTANDGSVIEGRISGVYGPMLHIVGKKMMTMATLDSLTDESLDLVAKHLASLPPEKPWRDTVSPVGTALKGKLQILEKGKLATFNPGDRPEPEFYVLYFSAHWCGPCRKFTPNLVTDYNSLRERFFGEKCEVLFMSWDKSRSDQIEYVSEAGMPWPVVKFNSAPDILDRWNPNSIPGLIVVNRNGDVLYSSHEGGKFRGPAKPFQDLLALLRQMEPGKPKLLKGRHRLAVRQHLLGAAEQTLPGKPYLTSFDQKRYHGLDGKTFEVRCTVNEKGHVDSYVVTPEFPPAYSDQSRQDISQWLFLPAVKNGKPVQQEIAVPMEFRGSAPKSQPAGKAD